MTSLRDAARQAVADTMRRLAEGRADYRERLIAASRAASAVDQALRPLCDPGLISLIDQLQWRLSQRLDRLPDKPDSDG